MSNAMWCTSRASPHSITRPTLVRWRSRIRWWCTALVSSSEGIGAYTESLLRSLNTMMRAPSSMKSLTLLRMSSIAVRKPCAPSLTRYKPFTTTLRRCGMVPSSSMWMILASSSLSIIGNGNANWRQLSALAANRLASGPRVEPTEVTTSSRMASSGGLVTWANNCLK